MNELKESNGALSPETIGFAPIRFRLIHLLYATALIGSACAIFGPYGLIVGLLGVVFWIVVFQLQPIGCGLTVAIGSTIFFLTLWGLFSAVMVSRGGVDPETRCSNKLRNIATAIHSYHSDRNRLPPTYRADKNGIPLYSWRTVILPYLDDLQLYNQYDFKEKWDSSKNCQLHSTLTFDMRCPVDENASAGETSYVAVRGEGATWTSQNGSKIEDFEIGLHKTVLVIETHHSGIHSLEPRDFSLEEAIQELSSEGVYHDVHRRKSVFWLYYDSGGHNVLFADGSVQFVPSLTEESAKALLTGDFEQVRDLPVNHRVRLRYANIFQTLVLLILALLPGYWVIGRMKQERMNDSNKSIKPGNTIT